MAMAFGDARSRDAATTAHLKRNSVALILLLCLDEQRLVGFFWAMRFPWSFARRASYRFASARPHGYLPG